MKRFQRGSLPTYVIVICLLQLLLFVALPAQVKSDQIIGKTYYVSPSGDDNDEGSADDPWRTVQKAAESVGPGDTVLIQPGIYRESVILHRSGEDGSPIVFQANDGGSQQGEQAVRLWGSEDSRGMIWHDLNAPECDAARLSAVAPENYGQVFCTNLSGDNWRVESSIIVPDLVTQVAENGDINRVIKAREPDLKWETPWKHHEFWWAADGGDSPNGGVSSTKLFDATNDPALAGIEAGNLSTLGDLTGGTLFALDTVVGTYQYRREIETMVPDGCTPGLDCAGVRLSTSDDLASRNVDFDFGALDGLGHLTKYYVEGAPQLLDQPGEWVYDLLSNKLYIWSDTSPAERHFEIAKRHVGITFSDPYGSNQSASNITIDGLSVAMINAHYKYRADKGETMLRPMVNFTALFPTDIQGAFTFFNRSHTASSGLTLQNLQITHASNGIQFFQESNSEVRARNIQILDSKIGDIDGQAIRIHAEINGAATNFPAIDGLTLRGNQIHNVGFRSSDNWLEQGVGVHLRTQGIQNLALSNNLLEGVSHSGISLVGTAPDNLPQSLILTDNTIRQTCQNGADCAAIYARSEGTPFNTLTLAENVLEDNQGWSYPLNACQAPYHQIDAVACVEQWWAGGQAGHGFYPDRAGGIILYRNLIRNNGFAGIYFSTGETRRGQSLIYNNIIENSLYGISMKEGDTFDNFQIKNNIFYENREAALLLNNAQGNVQIDYNFYKNGAANIAWWFDGAPIASLATAGTTAFENHGLEYTGPIFADTVLSNKTNYSPHAESLLINNGDVVPEIAGVSEGEYTVVGSGYDIGLWEFGGGKTPPPTTLTLQATQSTLQVGDMVEVIASISGANELVGLQTTCTVDPAVLAWENVQLGDFFTAPLIEQNELDGVSGTWRGRISQLPPALPLAGEGRFVTFTLRVVGSGTTAINCDPLAIQSDGAQLAISALSDPLAITEVMMAQVVYDLPGRVAYHGRRNQSGITVRVFEQPDMQSITGDDGQFVFFGIRGRGLYAAG